MLDDFNVGNNAENVDDWVSDEHITELSRKNPSKISEAMAIEVNSASSYPRDDTNTGLFTETDLDRCGSFFDAGYCWFAFGRRCYWTHFDAKCWWFYAVNAKRLGTCLDPERE